MKKIKKMPLVIIIFLVLVIVTSMGIIFLNARETEKELKNTTSIEMTEDKQKDEVISSNVESNTEVKQKAEETKESTDKKNVENNKTSSSSSNKITSSVGTNNSSTNNTNSNNSSNVESKQETKQEPVVEQKTEPKQTQNNNTNNNQNKTCGIWQSITNCKWDYDTSSACYSAGDRLTELYLNDWMDYNELHPDNPQTRDIQNTECYSVDTDQGTKWYLLVVCYSGTCRQNYKSIYLGK